jgi:hypothetical protein
VIGWDDVSLHEYTCFFAHVVFESFVFRMDKKSRSSGDNKKAAAAPAKKKQGGSSLIGSLILIGISAGLASLFFQKTGTIPSLTGPAHPAKFRFQSFGAFFPVKNQRCFFCCVLILSLVSFTWRSIPTACLVSCT